MLLMFSGMVSIRSMIYYIPCLRPQAPVADESLGKCLRRTSWPSRSERTVTRHSSFPINDVEHSALRIAQTSWLFDCKPGVSQLNSVFWIAPRDRCELVLWATSLCVRLSTAIRDGGDERRAATSRHHDPSPSLRSRPSSCPPLPDRCPTTARLLPDE